MLRCPDADRWRSVETLAQRCKKWTRTDRIFLSHSSHNDAFVEALRVRLQNCGYTVLEDSTFPSGDVLPDRVKGYIDNAHHVFGFVYIDYRVSVRPLTQALNALGE